MNKINLSETITGNSFMVAWKKILLVGCALFMCILLSRTPGAHFGPVKEVSAAPECTCNAEKQETNFLHALPFLLLPALE